MHWLERAAKAFVWRRTWPDAWLQIGRMRVLDGLGHPDKTAIFYAALAEGYGLAPGDRLRMRTPPVASR